MSQLSRTRVDLKGPLGSWPMVVVGKHVTFLLIVVEWLKSKSTYLLKLSNCCSPKSASTKKFFVSPSISGCLGRVRKGEFWAGEKSWFGLVREWCPFELSVVMFLPQK